MLEVECCNRPEALQKLEYIYRIHAAGSSGKNSKSFVLDTTLTSQMTGKHDWRRRSGRPLESPNSVVARLESKSGKLTMVERQELWLAKKTIRTAEMQLRAAEDSVRARAKSAPDLSRSQRRFTKVTTLPQQESNEVQSAITNSSRRATSTSDGSVTSANKSTNAGDVEGENKDAHKTFANSRRTSLGSGFGGRRTSVANAVTGVDSTLSNITNQPAQRKKIMKKKKKRNPIRDPFMQKSSK